MPVASNARQTVEIVVAEGFSSADLSGLRASFARNTCAVQHNGQQFTATMTVSAAEREKAVTDRRAFLADRRFVPSSTQEWSDIALVDIHQSGADLTIHISPRPEPMLSLAQPDRHPQ